MARLVFGLATITSIALAASRVQGARLPSKGGQALPSEPAASGTTGGIVVLRSPGPAMIEVAAGTFTMGAPLSESGEALRLCRGDANDPSWCELALLRDTAMLAETQGFDDLYARELEPHKVTLDAFWIDRLEVSVADYRRCADVGPCSALSYTSAKRFDKPELPVTLVTWDEARTYCRWKGGRLPTEAEWERAARGLSGRRFPWGNGWLRAASNHGALGATSTPSELRSLGRGSHRIAIFETDASDGFAELAPVGSFPGGQTPDGIEDLAGNVAEWVEDRYNSRFGPSAVTNPTGPATGQLRVVRGGSYLSDASTLRATTRDVALPGERQTWIGFRCASNRAPR